MGTPGNASTFYSQTSALQTAVAAASQPVTVNPGWSPSQRALAATYNRLGGLLGQVANIVNVPVSPALAVWYVESGGVAFTPNQAVIRFEVGRLLSAWGNANPANFDAHFQCGGRNGIPPPSWKNHAFSAAGGGPFVPVHQNQGSEYAALKLASDLAGQEVAVRCISIGGCQIMISNFPMLGYASGLDMYNAFQLSENAPCVWASSTSARVRAVACSAFCNSSHRILPRSLPNTTDQDRYRFMPANSRTPPMTSTSSWGEVDVS